VTYGDSLNRGVWSGTPRNFCDALGAAGIAVMPISALTPNRYVKLGRLSGALLFNKPSADYF